MDNEQEERFVCYHCKTGECQNCVGVPCACKCPIPAEIGYQKCVIKGCETRGKPQDGFDFFLCDPCASEMEALLNKMYAERQERHANN
jgi:hypothetical protein